MHDLLDQIEAIARIPTLQHVTLSTALTVPDIFGAVGSENGKATGSKYRSWLVQACNYKDEEAIQIYDFRCSMLHQGSARSQRGFRLIFCEPTPNNNVFHRIRMQLGDQTGYIMDVRTFASEVVAGGRTWLAQYGTSNRFERNVERFVQRYPDGLPPFIKGAAVYA